MSRRRPETAGITLLEMMIVVAIISLMAGVSFPAISSGLDTIRLRSAADALGSFFTQGLTRMERRQQVIEFVFLVPENRVVMRGENAEPPKEYQLTGGISLRAIFPRPPGEAQAPVVSVLLYPGAAFPRVAVELVNRRGMRRWVSIDPVTGAPQVGDPPAYVVEAQAQP